MDRFSHHWGPERPCLLQPLLTGSCERHKALPDPPWASVGCTLWAHKETSTSLPSRSGCAGGGEAEALWEVRDGRMICVQNRKA